MRLKVQINKKKFNSHYHHVLVYILEHSNPEKTDTSMDNSDEITGILSTCDKSTQAENDVFENKK